MCGYGVGVGVGVCICCGGMCVVGVSVLWNDGRKVLWSCWAFKQHVAQSSFDFG